MDPANEQSILAEITCTGLSLDNNIFGLKGIFGPLYPQSPFFDEKTNAHEINLVWISYCYYCWQKHQCSNTIILAQQVGGIWIRH